MAGPVDHRLPSNAVVPQQWSGWVSPAARDAVRQASDRASAAAARLSAVALDEPEFMSPDAVREMTGLMAAAESLLRPPASRMLSVVGFCSMTMWTLFAEVDARTGTDLDCFGRQSPESRFATGPDVLDAQLWAARRWFAMSAREGHAVGPPGSLPEQYQPVEQDRPVAESRLGVRHPSVRSAVLLAESVSRLELYCDSVWHDGRPWYGVVGHSAVRGLSGFAEDLLAGAARLRGLCHKSLSMAACGEEAAAGHPVRSETAALAAGHGRWACLTKAGPGIRLRCDRSHGWSGACLACAGSGLAAAADVLLEWMDAGAGDASSRQAAAAAQHRLRHMADDAVDRLWDPFDAESEGFCSELMAQERDRTVRKAVGSDPFFEALGVSHGRSARLYQCLRVPPALEAPLYGTCRPPVTVPV